MQRTALFAAALLAAAIATSPIVTPQEEPRRPRPGVEEHMEAFKTNLKSIATTLADGETEALLRSVTSFQNHAQSAKELEPTNLDEVEPSEHEEHRRAWRRAMIDLQRTLLDLEERLVDEDREGAMALIRGKLLEQRNAAHERFQPAQ